MKTGRPPERPRGGRIARRQQALLRLSTEIAAAQDERDVYRSVVSGLHDEALGYNFLGVFLHDEATGDRVLQASVGWQDIPDDMRVHPGEGLSEMALQDGTLHYTADVTGESRYYASLASGSEVDVPLRVDGQTIGVLVVESSEPNAFGSEDFEILTAAANQASIAIGRARLLAAERARADEHKGQPQRSRPGGCRSVPDRPARGEPEDEQVDWGRPLGSEADGRRHVSGYH